MTTSIETDRLALRVVARTLSRLYGDAAPGDNACDASGIHGPRLLDAATIVGALRREGLLADPSSTLTSRALVAIGKAA